MDRITQSLLSEFTAEQNLASQPEDKQFEHFAAFLTVGRSLSEAIDTSDVVVGSGGDTGIDAIAIIVNGSLVDDVTAINEYVERNGYLDVTFSFVQAERSPSFDTAKKSVNSPSEFRTSFVISPRCPEAVRSSISPR
jgi:hypothetical protein